MIERTKFLKIKQNYLETREAQLEQASASGAARRLLRPLYCLLAGRDKSLYYLRPIIRYWHVRRASRRATVPGAASPYIGSQYL